MPKPLFGIIQAKQNGRRDAFQLQNSDVLGQLLALRGTWDLGVFCSWKARTSRQLLVALS
jgi:hypothetical protein